MALNWAMFHPDHSPIPLPHEQTLITIDSSAEFLITIPDAPPSSSANAGGSGGSKRLKEIGRVWLTDQRLIFASLGWGAKPLFESVSIPLYSILSTKFEQPYFGANYLVLEVKPSPDGGLTDGTTIEIRFKDRGLFEFVSVLEKTRERAIYMKRQAASEEDHLPTYTSSAEDAVEAPPGYDA